MVGGADNISDKKSCIWTPKIPRVALCPIIFPFFLFFEPSWYPRTMFELWLTMKYTHNISPAPTVFSLNRLSHLVFSLISSSYSSRLLLLISRFAFSEHKEQWLKNTGYFKEWLYCVITTPCFSSMGISCFCIIKNSFTFNMPLGSPSCSNTILCLKTLLYIYVQ